MVILYIYILSVLNYSDSCIITQDTGQIICMIQCKWPCLTLTFYTTMTKNATVQLNLTVHSLDNYWILLRIHIQLHHNPPCSSVHHLKEGTMHALVEQIKVTMALPRYLYPNHWSHPYETTLLEVKNNYLSFKGCLKHIHILLLMQ
jgi:hypothetical protein